MSFERCSHSSFDKPSQCVAKISYALTSFSHIKAIGVLLAAVNSGPNFFRRRRC